jgi:protein SCO1/2
MVMNAPAMTRFSLIDHNGAAVTEADFRDRYLLVYFGFTNCRVVCPRSLAKLSDVLARLGAAAGNMAEKITPLYIRVDPPRDTRAAKITPLFISVDPARDTPAAMKTYLEALYPFFTGLTGAAEEIDAVRKEFRVFAERKAEPDDAEGYAVAHTAIAYLMGPDGAYRAHFPEHLTIESITDRIEKILAEDGFHD